MKKFLMLVAVITWLTGCVTNRGSQISEVSWQAMNVVDMGQTLHIAKEPGCYREANIITKTMIGSHPSKSEVVAASAVFAVGHYFISSWLDKRVDQAFASNSDNRGAWYVGRIGWHGLNFVTKAWQINHNNNIGLTPFGSGCP